MYLQILILKQKDIFFLIIPNIFIILPHLLNNIIADCKIGKNGIFTRIFWLNTTDFSPFLWYNLVVRKILKTEKKSCEIKLCSYYCLTLTQMYSIQWKKTNRNQLISLKSTQTLIRSYRNNLNTLITNDTVVNISILQKVSFVICFCKDFWE